MLDSWRLPGWRLDGTVVRGLADTGGRADRAIGLEPEAPDLNAVAERGA